MSERRGTKIGTPITITQRMRDVKDRVAEDRPDIHTPPIRGRVGVGGMVEPGPAPVMDWRPIGRTPRQQPRQQPLQQPRQQPHQQPRPDMEFRPLDVPRGPRREADGTFRAAFAAARRAGDRTFEWRGKRYTTDKAGEAEARRAGVARGAPATPAGFKRLPDQTFRQAFAAARKAGMKTFNWKGRRFSTEMKE